MMCKTAYLILLLGLLAQQAALSSGIQVDIPGRCPDVCSTDIESVFFSCIDEIDKGCALRLCDSTERGVQCGLKGGTPDEIYTGEEVTISGLPISKTMTTNLGIRGLVPKTDVYFLVDGTGSMGAAIGAFRRSFLRLAETLSGIGDFAYGVGVFRDETELEMGFKHLLRITANVTRAKRVINTLRSKGGDDAEEANLVALYKIATGDFVNWREGAGRVVLLFGDAVGHEPTCFDDVTLNRRVVARALKDADITLEAVGTEIATLDDRTSQFGCGNGTAGEGQTTFIANRTGGSVTNLETGNPPEVYNVFSEVLGTASTVVEVAESNCDAGIRIKSDPPFPALLRAGEKVNVTFRLRRRVCRPAFFECSVTFKSGVSVTEPLTVKFVDPRGCPV